MNGKTITLDVESSGAVFSVMAKLEAFQGDESRMAFAGKTLEGGHSVSEYNIRIYFTLECVGRLRGGVGPYRVDGFHFIPCSPYR